MLRLIEHDEVLEIKVCRTIAGRPVYFTSFFFVDGLLIDTGPPHVSREIAAVLARLPVEQVVITHQHEDHTGNCRMIQEKWALPVYAHPLTLKVMAAPPQIQYYRKFMWGDAPACAGAPLPGTVATPRFRFQVIHTPGHSPDHVSFFEPERGWLFCGDLFLGEKLGCFMQGEDIADHLRSLKQVLRLRPRILFCGLKGNVDNAAERLTAKYRYWWELGCRAARLAENGVPAGRIRRALFGGEVPFYRLSQGNWGRRHLVDSFVLNRAIFLEHNERPPDLSGGPACL
jgi:glyoxylase-like metal-dependent hydrolase (beta-lactamase superfamily II)